MRDVLAPFETSSGRSVSALKRPRPRIAVDPAVLGGYPVIAGTRVPYDVVAHLAQDDLEPSEITAIRNAASKGYQAVLTLDVAQLESADESGALRRSRLPYWH